MAYMSCRNRHTHCRDMSAVQSWKYVNHLHKQGDGSPSETVKLYGSWGLHCQWQWHAALMRDVALHVQGNKLCTLHCVNIRAGELTAECSTELC